MRDTPERDLAVAQDLGSDWQPWIEGYEHRYITCPLCKGSGGKWNGYAIVICPKCSADGQVHEVRGVQAKKEHHASHRRQTNS